MKPTKSIALIAAGALVFSSCSKKTESDQTSATGQSDTTRNAGTNPNGTRTPPPTTSQRTGAPVGAGAAAHEHSDAADAMSDTSSSTKGSGAISDEDASEDLTRDPDTSDEEYLDETEVQEEEYSDVDDGTGAGVKSQDMEYVDETSSESDEGRGGREARMLQKQNEIDNTSSEADDVDR